MLTYRVGLALLFPDTWRWKIMLSPWVHSRPTRQWEDMTWSPCAYCRTCFSPASSNCWVTGKTSLIAQGFTSCYIYIHRILIRARAGLVPQHDWHAALARAIFQREFRKCMSWTLTSRLMLTLQVSSFTRFWDDRDHAETCTLNIIVVSTG